MKIRVCACQQFLHQEISEETIRQIKSNDTDFVCLPEHYPLSKEIRNLEQAAAKFDERKRYLAQLAARLETTLVGGTLTEQTADGYYNTCYVFDHGKEIGYYRKVHPTVREQEAGVLRGNEFKIFDVRGIRAGVLICADVLNVRSFEEVASQRAQITFVPTASPFRPGEKMEAKYERDRSIFVEGAHRMGCPVVKTCGVGTTFGHPIQGRSLIATADGIIARAEPHQEDQSILLFAELEV